MLRFGEFRLDVDGGELHREGTRVTLQPQPFRVLTLLATRAGRLVTRGEIRSRIWPQDTFVDFEQGLNYCIKRIRGALGDDAKSPRFVETRPRLGYRFIATVEDVAPGPAAPRRITLAVLPFDNLSSDPEQEIFVDGLTEEMISQLGRLNADRLGVIARTSTIRYRRTEKAIGVISRELGVSYLLEGSVRRAGLRVRVTAQLIQSCDESHIWADSYERHLNDVLELQCDVAHAIAREVHLQLASNEPGRFACPLTVNTQACESSIRPTFDGSQPEVVGSRGSR